MRLVLIGAPGSGKGTQGELLAGQSGAQHIATGDLLRAELRAGTALGRAVAGYLDSGTLVPDEILLDLVIPLVTASGSAGFILDGFPRSVAQAIRFDELAGPDAAVEQAVYLEVSREELVQRLLRRADEQGRSDDNEDVIVKRLRVFEDETSPLIEHYRQAGLLTVIDGGAPVDEVRSELTAASAGAHPT